MPASDSQFSMLRGAIALGWVDGYLAAPEKTRLLDFINGNEMLSNEQRGALKHDLETKITLKDIWPHITEKIDRARLIDLAKDLFLEDGAYAPQEKIVYQQIYEQHIASLDKSDIEAELHALSQHQHADDADETAHYQGSDTIIGKVGKFIWSLERKLGL